MHGLSITGRPGEIRQASSLAVQSLDFRDVRGLGGCVDYHVFMMSTDSRLEYNAVTLSTAGPYDTGVWDMTLRLMPGELALVRLQETHPRTPLADLCKG